MSQELFQIEQDALLTSLIEEYYLKRMTSTDYKLSRVEFYITPECDQLCDYCYVVKHRKETYPASIVNHEIILYNMRKFLNYAKSRNLHMMSLDLFSGEIWGSQFGYDVLQVLYDFYKEYKFTDNIVIPSNMNFLFTETGKDTIQRYVNMFKEIDVYLAFSASIDGLYLDDEFRPMLNRYSSLTEYQRTTEHYEEIFKFCAKNGYAFHPMVSAKSCKYWIENFDWYMSMLTKYYGKPVNLMMLEVRDDNWEQEDIDYLKKLLKHIIDFKLKYWFDNDLTRFAEYIARVDRMHDRPNNISVYSVGNRIGCGIQNTLCLRMGDMAIIPCHRTSYKPFIYGWMDIDENNNMTIRSNNPEFAIRVLAMNPNISHPGCDTCTYNKICMKGCLGSQFETNKDPLQVCESVCNMLKQKMDFLIDTYEEMGVWQILKEEGKASRTLAEVQHIQEWREGKGE